MEIHCTAFLRLLLWEQTLHLHTLLGASEQTRGSRTPDKNAFWSITRRKANTSIISEMNNLVETNVLQPLNPCPVTLVTEVIARKHWEVNNTKIITAEKKWTFLTLRKDSLCHYINFVWHLNFCSTSVSTAAPQKMSLTSGPSPVIGGACLSPAEGWKVPRMKILHLCGDLCPGYTFRKFFPPRPTQNLSSCNLQPWPLFVLSHTTRKNLNQ